MKQQLNEEFRRMQKLAGTSLNEDIRSTEEKDEFFRNLKPGDKVTYLGPDKNGFTKGDIVKVLTYISNSTFEKTFTLEKNGKKLRVKSQSSVGPINDSLNEANEDLFSKYKEKLEEFREEFVKDLKANKDKLKKLSNEDKKKLSKLIRDITDALDNTLPDTQ